MIRILGTAFAALLGLAFGSFLNVCLTRWPEGESIVKPRSHCRGCDRTLTWWENIPLLSWLALRGRCRTCIAKIHWRYPLVELAVATLWAISAWQGIHGVQDLTGFLSEGLAQSNIFNLLFFVGGKMILCWLLVALAVLDAQYLWLPDWLTLPGAGLGIIGTLIHFCLLWKFASPVPLLMEDGSMLDVRHRILVHAIWWHLGILAAAGLVLLIRWLYWLVRRREGIGLGDAKLMAMMAAWLGFAGAFLAFAIGAVLGAIFALVLLAVPQARRQSETWLTSKLALGTFICIGGIISSLWGRPIIAAYMRWAGF